MFKFTRRIRGHEIWAAIESVELIEEVSAKDHVAWEAWKNMENRAN